MIDLERIERIKLMPIAAARAAMKEYAAELGVTTKARTIDNMVSEMGAQLNARAAEQEAQLAMAVEVHEPQPVADIAMMAADEVVEVHEPQLMAAPQPRQKMLRVFPAALNPLEGRSFRLYAMPTGIDNIDDCTFQWQFKAPGGSYADIGQATEQTYVVEKAANGDLGEYQCIITEPASAGSTATTSTPSKVETLATIPDGFPMMNFYNAKWIDFYGCSFAPVYWGAIHGMQKILANDTTNMNTSTIHRTMGMKQDCVPLLDLISNTTFLIATDSRDGYKYQISSDTDKDNPIKIYGRFNKNDA